MSSKTTTAERRPVPVRRGSKALITAGDRLLLVKERHADGTSFWTLPGGGVEPAESMEAALRRELAEDYVRGTPLSFSDIASLVGFANPSAFHGAFRRWYRCSPGRYRRRYGMAR